MKNLIHFLSGNVPGGFPVYIFVLFVIFFVLFYLYRASELFTRSHFKWWFLGSWMLVTIIYAFLWVSNPSPDLLRRYSVFITASDPQDDWLAKFYRDELSFGVKPFRGRNEYFFPQRWCYLSGVEQSDLRFEDICRKVPIHQVVFGKIIRKENQVSLELDLKEYPSEKIVKSLKISVNDERPESDLPDIFKWMQKFFALKADYQFQDLVDKSLIDARDKFFKGNYKESDQLFKKVIKQYPNNPIVQKWYYYNLIKLAGTLRPQKERNPFETKKMPYQVMLSEARAFLKNLVKENMESNINDDFLSNMLAESYLLEENYNEAGVFLKNAYVINPFNINVLENLSYLHPSRYHDLGFHDESAVYERIINLCPIYADVLLKYVEKLLKFTPVHAVNSKKAAELIEKFLAINPNSATSWLMLGEYYHTSLNRQKAFNAFFKADSLEPNNTIVQYNLGVMYYLENSLDEADKHFKKAIELGDYLDAHLYLGMIHMKKGEYEKALEQFRYRVAHKKGEDDHYAKEAMIGIRECLEALNISIPGEGK